MQKILIFWRRVSLTPRQDLVVAQVRIKGGTGCQLDVLIDWIAQYATRSDTFSQAAHEGFYRRYEGVKSQRTGS